MKSLTKSGLIEFHDYAVSKGLLKANTGNARKAAVSQILEDFGVDDDLTSINVPSEVLKYNNRHPGKLSPDSLTAYQQRVILALEEFKKYLANPLTYKGVTGRTPLAVNAKVGVKVKATLTDSKPAEPGTATIETAPVPKHPTSAVTDTSLMMPFPLRPTFLAQLIIPRDLSKDEANRLCAFIQALAVDTPMVPV
jgi:hypothetical protein